MNIKTEESKPIHALITIVVFSLIASPFVYWSYKDTKEKQDYCQKKGIRTIAFFSYVSGSMASATHWFAFEVNGEKYKSGINLPYFRDPNYPFKETPMMVAYDKNDPSRNILVPEEAFNYRGYNIRWIQDKETHHYYMKVKKIE